MGRKRKRELSEWLQIIQRAGSVSKAARQENISQQALNQKFNELADDNPHKIEYKRVMQENQKRNYLPLNN